MSKTGGGDGFTPKFNPMDQLEKARRAIFNLDSSDYEKLRRMASWLKKKDDSSRHEKRDLINEAIRQVLDGTRRWPDERVDMVKMLKETMKSISSHWRNRAHVIREVHKEEIWRAVSQSASPEEVLIETERLDMIDREFAGDPEVRTLFRRLRSGCEPKEAAIDLGWNDKEFNTIYKRYCRKLSRIQDGPGAKW